MAAAGPLNYMASAGQTLAANRVSPMASSSSGTNSTGASGASSAGITANDFLILLVTEMKNQDPTASTDPNEYINQLVNVNSLQQLISINETLTGAFGSSGVSAYTQTSPASSNAANRRVQPEAAANANAAQTPAQAPAQEPDSTNDAAYKAMIGKSAHGNLSPPATNPAAVRLAHALDGHASTLPIAR